ncbi:hypothetical protein AGR5A_Lc50090 [Agrobacterium genomosp. 5 str. CFBP 6626]|nr:hypothetical protein AGR5A_Lc50090 [Agrobacterium genomosp. 5 str. CFBP 6626]
MSNTAVLPEGRHPNRRPPFYILQSSIIRTPSPRIKSGMTEESFPPKLYLSCFASAFLAFSSISSYHMAFMTAKMAARGRPSSQAKYHMFDLLLFV